MIYTSENYTKEEHEDCLFTTLSRLMDNDLDKEECKTLMDLVFPNEKDYKYEESLEYIRKHPNITKEYYLDVLFAVYTLHSLI